MKMPDGQCSDSDDYDEELMQLLRERGGLIREEVKEREREHERRGQAHLKKKGLCSSSDEGGDQTEDEHKPGKRKRGSTSGISNGGRGAGGSGKGGRQRNGYWITERFGPHRMNYKRVYVDGSGKKFTGKAAYAVSLVSTLL